MSRADLVEGESGAEAVCLVYGHLIGLAICQQQVSILEPAGGEIVSWGALLEFQGDGWPRADSRYIDRRLP